MNTSVYLSLGGFVYLSAIDQGGILEFDGVNWREIEVPQKTVRALAVSDRGTIYIGGKGEFGCLEPGPRGALRYVSFSNILKGKYRHFSSVYGVHATAEGIYFRTLKFLFLWDQGEIKEVKKCRAGNYFVASFLCAGKLYIRQRGIGLLEKSGSSLKLIPGGEDFANRSIYMMAPYNAEKLLIGTRSAGFYLYDGKKAEPFPTEADNYLKENQLSHGIRLLSTPGDFALATLRGGLVIFDSRGSLKNIFNKASGLMNNDVKSVFEDFQGNLWLALDDGIAKIEYYSPFSFYDESHSALPGKVLSLSRHGPGSDLYAGTSYGLYYLASAGKFSPVPGIPGECWDLLSTRGSLLTATSGGVFQVKNGSKRQVTGEHAYVLLPSLSDPDRTWVGQANGLVSLYFDRKTDRWQVEKQFESLTREIRTIAEDKKGNLWLGTLTAGALKVDFSVHGTFENPGLRRYDSPAVKLPDEVHVFSAAGHVMFAFDSRGIFRFNEEKKTFYPDDTLGREFSGGEKGHDVFHIAADNKKNIWIHSNARNIQAIPRADGTFTLNKKPFLRLPLAHVQEIYPDPGGNATWFASVDGLIRYDTRVEKNYDLPFRTLIRKAWVNGKEVFGGYKKHNDMASLFPVIDYKDRNLRFEFAASFFEAEAETLYQCLLEGYDREWTTWSKETWKDYTNLDPGLNTFRVRAKNVYGKISSEDFFRFKVLPPWYRTWWAFLFYAAAVSFMVFLVAGWRSRKLLKEKQRLEKIIAERTVEINEKNRQLQEQSEKLREMDKIKSRFFANISHEFRTPLTLIMGPLEQMLTGARESEAEQKKKMRLMLRSSRRLLGLINQLLDLSKFESGKMKLQAARQNIIPFLKGIVESFHSLTTQNEITLKFHSEAEDITLYFDAEKIEKAICNLLFNAVKFTPPGGTITVTVTLHGNSKNNQKSPPGCLEISVKDTGIGIASDQLEYIFDRFYQAESLGEYGHKGSGIGLALTKELVSLHSGDITVQSEEGKGSEFILRLPLGEEHLKPGEIVTLQVEPARREKQQQEPELPMIEAGEEEPAPADVADLPAAGKNIILVVDDSADVRSYIRGAIEPPYRVVEAKNGEAGIKKARQIIPDLVISDIMMPGIDGYELCRVLKKDVTTSHIPIILLTAKAGEEDVIEGLETGADDYVIKPFSSKILCARIKNLIDIRSKLQQSLRREMTLQPVKASLAQLDREFLNDLQAVIEEHIDEPEFNVEKLCKKLYMSHSTLYRKVFALSGESPIEFIRSYRLKKGAELLKNNFGTVLEVALEVGFSSANYFSKCFRKKFKLSPTDYQTMESK